MKHLMIALLLATSVLAVAQTPAPSPQTKAEKKAARKAEKKAAREAKAVPSQAAKPAPDPAPAPAAKPAPVPRPAPAAKAAPSTSGIVANKDSRTFHRADCTFVAKMKPANRVSFVNATEAAKAGYKPCKVCKPQ